MLQTADMSGYGVGGYGDTGMTGYEDPNAVAGYGTVTGEARSVCSYLCYMILCVRCTYYAV